MASPYIQNDVTIRKDMFEKSSEILFQINDMIDHLENYEYEALNASTGNLLMTFFALLPFSVFIMFAASKSSRVLVCFSMVFPGLFIFRMYYMYSAINKDAVKLD